MSYTYAEQRPKLFTEQGLALVQQVTANAVRLCRAASVVRADKTWAGVTEPDAWVRLAALDYLVERGVLGEITGPDAAGQHRVFTLNPHSEWSIS